MRIAKLSRNFTEADLSAIRSHVMHTSTPLEPKTILRSFGRLFRASSLGNHRSRKLFKNAVLITPQPSEPLNYRRVLSLFHRVNPAFQSDPQVIAPEVLYTVPFHSLSLRFLGLYFKLLFLSPAERDYIKRVHLNLAIVDYVTARLKKLGVTHVFINSNTLNITNLLLAYSLKNEKTIECTYYIGYSYLNHGYCVAADKVCFSNRWSMEAFRRCGLILSAKRVSFVCSPGNIDKRPSPSVRKGSEIAIYTTGYFARLNRRGSPQAFWERALEEQKILSSILAICKEMEHINFTLFPHPTVEPITAAAASYPDFLSLPNVAMRDAEVSSSASFGDFDLGLCTQGSVFFERIELGYKTLCLVGACKSGIFEHEDLSPISMSVGSLNEDVIDKFLQMPQSQFIALIGQETATQPQAMWE